MLILEDMENSMLHFFLFVKCVPNLNGKDKIWLFHIYFIVIIEERLRLSRYGTY